MTTTEDILTNDNVTNGWNHTTTGSPGIDESFRQKVLCWHESKQYANIPQGN